jgi:hypothetical protein
MSLKCTLSNLKHDRRHQYQDRSNRRNSDLKSRSFENTEKKNMKRIEQSLWEL